ncbi:NAD-dependent succinate-semialdehyde dehydrogenase [Desulfovibrio inopinatus]|uniref:NAD-dependent succinate-semialdehyde dehydrogenase n=1 Tax=Desulfovibrio inopinatus TaxID=102109 RepID=UPI000417032E|nr:NAD-dependent succinate-semialdehyde dehydrogenase [Desulfovibrio inopinatus]
MLTENFLSECACYIDGEFIAADSGQSIPVTNPFDGSVVGNVPDMRTDETVRAINAAHAALPAWKRKTALQRAEILMNWYRLTLENIDMLARIVTLEGGKPLAEAKAETNNGASYMRWFAEEARRNYGDVVPAPFADQRLVVTREPVGVVGVITPWNFPMSMIARKVSAALAAGCTAVVRPAILTPLTALAMARLAHEAGAPNGVLNVLTGSSRVIGKELTSNKIVRKISFTGSTGVGKILLNQTASTVKRMSMELGGNAPFIVFDDADIDAAAAGAVFCKFRNSGQTCICANRMYVHDAVYDTFLEKMAEHVKTLKPGNGLDDGINMGPLINADALEKTKSFTEDALAKGGRIVCGGKPHALGGLFYEPTIIADATDDMLFASEEIFGPIAPIFRFTDENDVIERANSTDYGLAAYFYTRDAARIWRVSEALEFGLLGINDGRISTCEGPFGGVKESGFGREGSRYGLDDYTVLKYACQGGITTA